MKNCFFTVGIMTYNYASYIEDAIKSVINQTLTDWELYIIDDASTDGTENIVQKYLIDARIKYIRHNQNRGQAETWGHLLKIGNGKIVCTLHADDIWKNEILEVAYDAFNADQSLDMYSFNWNVIGTNTKGPVRERYIKGLSAFKEELIRFTLLPSATFIRRSLINKCNLPLNSFKLAVDTNYFYRLLLQANMFRSTDRILVNYRVHSQGATGVALKTDRYYVEVIENYNLIKKESIVTKYHGLINKKISDKYFESASHNLKAGNKKMALISIKKGVLTKKRNVFSYNFLSLILKLFLGKAPVVYTSN